MGEICKQNHTVNGKGREPFVNGVYVSFPLAGGGGGAPLREEEEDLTYNIWKVCSSRSNFF